MLKAGIIAMVVVGFVFVAFGLRFLVTHPTKCGDPQREKNNFVCTCFFAVALMLVVAALVGGIATGVIR